MSTLTKSLWTDIWLFLLTFSLWRTHLTAAQMVKVLILAFCSARFKHLSCFDVLAHKCVVGHGKLWCVVVDVQHLDEDWHSSCLTRVIWRKKRMDLQLNAQHQLKAKDDDYLCFSLNTAVVGRKTKLLISVATTEMLCHLDISLSRAFSVVMVPFTESMLNSLSRSVWRSMEYLQEQKGDLIVLEGKGKKVTVIWSSENERARTYTRCVSSHLEMFKVKLEVGNTPNGIASVLEKNAQG